MSRKIAPWQIVVIVGLAFCAGVLPLLIGELLGFGAFVVTSVVMVFVLVWLGALIARVAPSARWRGVALAALVVASAFVAVPAALERVMNGRRAVLYVEVAPADVSTFTHTLATIVKEQGGEAGVGEAEIARHSEDEPKRTEYLLDANIGWTHIFANGSFMPTTEHYPCSGRAIFRVYVQPYVSFVGTPEPVLGELRRVLVDRRYDVRDQSFPCEAPRPER